MSVRVRMAPSPTGLIHIGNLRSGLYNELFARQQGGTLLLRIEDTDRTRYVEGAAEAYCRSLQAMNIIPDEGAWIDDQGNLIERGEKGPYLQSKRQKIHQDYAAKLIAMGKAYPCFCTEERLKKMREDQYANKQPTRYDQTCRKIAPEEASKRIKAGESHVIRLAVPEQGSVTFHDEIRGDVTFEWKEIDDQVIIKSDGMPTYHLAATCDDHDMEMTHVIRGEEWLSSTPKHLFIYECFGWTPPVFAHLPLLLNSDRSKLSKRQRDVAVEDYLKKGYLPEAILNFVALLGWNPTGDREIYTHQELIDLFDLKSVNKSGAVVNFEKLDWLNGHYLKEKTDKEFVDYVRPTLKTLGADEIMIQKITPLIRERVKTLEDVKMISPQYFKTRSQATIQMKARIIEAAPLKSDLVWKTQPADEAVERLEAVLELVHVMPKEDWNSPATLEQKIKQMIQDRGWGNGEVLWPLRVALSGKKQSPPPFDLLYVFGEPRSVERIQNAIQTLRS